VGLGQDQFFHEWLEFLVEVDVDPAAQSEYDESVDDGVGGEWGFAADFPSLDGVDYLSGGGLSSVALAQARGGEVH
jgi:hypothetical protein